MKKDLSFNQEQPVIGFDTRVTHRDPKTGLVAAQDPYTLRVVSEGTDKIYLFERPVGSGNLFGKQGNKLGRWVKNEWVKDAPHVEFIMPETQDEKLAREYAQKDLEIAELQKELAAVKAEKEKKTQPPKTDKGA